MARRASSIPIDRFVIIGVVSPTGLALALQIAGSGIHPPQPPESPGPLAAMGPATRSRPTHHTAGFNSSDSSGPYSGSTNRPAKNRAPPPRRSGASTRTPALD